MTKATKKKPVDLATTIEQLAGDASPKAIFKLQDSANKSLAKGISEYQTVFCALILHVAKHGDTTVVDRVLEKFPEGMRKKSAKAFLEEFGMIEFSEDGVAVLNRSKKVSLARAIETPWTTMGGKEEKPFDLNAAIAALYNKAKKRQAKAVEGDVIDDTAMALLAGVVNRVGTGTSVAA